jgi:hypothetical protein
MNISSMLFINAINSQRANEQVSNIPYSRLKVKPQFCRYRYLILMRTSGAWKAYYAGYAQWNMVPGW